MKIETLERYIKKTAIPYGDLLKRAVKGGLKVCFLGNAVVKVADATNHVMTLYFEDESVYKENKEIGLVGTEYNF